MTLFPSDLHAAVRALPKVALVGVTILSLVSCGKPKTASDAPSQEPKQEPVSSASAAGAAADAPGAQPGAAAMTAAPGTEAVASAAPGTAPQMPGAETKAAMKEDSPYATAEVLVNDLTTKLQAGDWNGFLDLAGPQAATGENKVRLRSLMVERSFRVSATNPVAVTDRSESAKLVTVKFQPGPEDAGLGEQRIELDLNRGEAERWGVAALRVPDILELAAAKMRKDAEGGAGDPLTVAGQFLQAVVKRDFASARRAVDTSKLSDEKLAALFIVVEEGEFKPHSNKPLISTMARTNIAWVIARLESAAQQSDFGIEMARATDAAPWQIVGLNFSKLIQKVASQAGAGDIAYEPLQKDLKGGEQIVIYFDFDGTSVNQRAEKQLRIIGDILRADSKRTLTINGHADILGTQDYNKDLSERRAGSVREFLMKFGIPGQQIITQGFGNAVPKAPNLNPDGTDNPSGRAQNRRAEVYLKF